MDSPSSSLALTANVSPWSKHVLHINTPESDYQNSDDSTTGEDLHRTGPLLPRAYHSSSMVSSPSGDIFIFGGMWDRGDLNDTWKIEISGVSDRPIGPQDTRDVQVTASLMEATGEAPCPRMGHQSVLTDGFLIVWGGLTPLIGTGLNFKFGDDWIYFFNIVTRHWTRLDIQPAPPPRHWFAACMCGRKLVVFGGIGGEAIPLNDLWAFDMDSLIHGAPEWKKIEIASGSRSPPGRTGHAMVAYENQLYMFGGDASAIVYNDTWCFDMNTRIWTELRFDGSIPPPRAYYSAALVENAVYIFGGHNREGDKLADTWVFKINEKMWYRLPYMESQPPPTSGHVLATSKGRVLLVGGEGVDSFRSKNSDPPVVHILDTDSVSPGIKRSEVVPKDLAAAVLEAEKMERGPNKTRIKQQEAAISSLGSVILQARSEGMSPRGDQESATFATHDTITGAMSSTEILQYLVQHGCHDISAELEISHVSEYPVSSGGFGDVYCATLQNGDRVGLKCLRMLVGSTDEGKKFLKRAAHELYVWSKCKHPNILELSGVMLFRDQITMVSPWVERGHLRWFLSQHPQVDRCRMCVSIADGVDYLHTKGIVHGDLKPDNILIGKDNAPQLTDFGNAVLSEYTLQFTQSTTTQSISMRWTAPEILSEETKVTQAGDIYALGMIIYETITGVLPYAGAKDPTVMRNILAGKVPNRPETYIPTGVEQADHLWSLITSCWAHDPHERPKAWEVRKLLDGITPEGLVTGRC